MPTYNLFAAVWRVTWATSKDLSLVQKGVKLTEAVDEAYEFMRAARARTNVANPVYLFAAPEYYWIKDGLYNLYSKDEKATIYSALRGTSAEYGEVLMFPGTVNWQVPKAEHVGAQPTNIKEKAFVGYNACPVYLDGHLLLDYYKKFNDGELDKRNTAAFGAGPIGGAQDFVAKGLRFGLDICGDLNQGQLQLTLGGQQVDVMVLTAGTMSHDFTESRLGTIPVRDGGAFVHCDNTGKAEKNGVWVVTRGQGWHGSHRNEVTLSFDDLDDTKRTVGFPTNSDDVPGQTMTVTAVAGFGTVRDLTAAVTTKSNGWVRKFTLTIPGGRSVQTAEFEKDGADVYKVTLTRSKSRAKVVRAKWTDPDRFGMGATGRGNVSKIGKLLGGPNDRDLDCYSVPIVR
ncbi:MAG: hypothetical protein ACLQVG_19335 [Terriglobia bacterium]